VIIWNGLGLGQFFSRTILEIDRVIYLKQVGRERKVGKRISRGIWGKIRGTADGAEKRCVAINFYRRTEPP